MFRLKTNPKGVLKKNDPKIGGGPFLRFPFKANHMGGFPFNNDTARGFKRHAPIQPGALPHREGVQGDGPKSSSALECGVRCAKFLGVTSISILSRDPSF